MNDYERQITLKFRLLAAFYDLFDLAFLLDQNRNPRQALARKIPNETLRILDACTGTANSALVVAAANGRNQIVGIDLSPDMLAVAARKIQRRNLANIQLCQMDATSMTFGDAEFDIAMISFGLHELDYPLMMSILREMSRVVKDGGALYLVDYEQESGLRNWLLSANLRLFEPKHMSQFLTYDWAGILQDSGTRITGIEKYLFSKLISAAR